MCLGRMVRKTGFSAQDFCYIVTPCLGKTWTSFQFFDNQNDSFS